MTAGPHPGEAPATVTIDAGALAGNWRLLARRAGTAETAAVVKADAYGTGIGVAVPALRSAGCRTFFVAHAGEGRAVRAAAPDAVVYVLNGLLPGMAPELAAHGLRPVLGSLAEIEEWNAHAVAGRVAPEAAIHVDTGMNRLGLSVDETAEIARRLPSLAVRPSLLMSHFVESEVPGSAVTARQVRDFAALRPLFPGVPGSLSNSSGLFCNPAAFHDLVRPGYALYGGNPTPGRPNPMRPVVSLTARIVQVRDVQAGDTVGYNGQWTAPGPRRLATISVGYADGYPRAASARDGQPGGEAVVGGVRCPLAGRVSMDLIVLDVSEAPSDAVRRGAPVQLIGETLTVDEVGARAGTIGYEILTGLGRRYARTVAGA
ncbi:alanine racemase [Alsobacter sp. R-9]